MSEIENGDREIINDGDNAQLRQELRIRSALCEIEQFVLSIREIKERLSTEDKRQNELQASVVANEAAIATFEREISCLVDCIDKSSWSVEKLKLWRKYTQEMLSSSKERLHKEKQCAVENRKCCLNMVNTWRERFDRNELNRRFKEAYDACRLLTERKRQLERGCQSANEELDRLKMKYDEGDDTEKWQKYCITVANIFVKNLKLENEILTLQQTLPPEEEDDTIFCPETLCSQKLARLTKATGQSDDVMAEKTVCEPDKTTITLANADEQTAVTVKAASVCKSSEKPVPKAAAVETPGTFSRIPFKDMINTLRFERTPPNDGMMERRQTKFMPPETETETPSKMCRPLRAMNRTDETMTQDNFYSTTKPLWQFDPMNFMFQKPNNNNRQTAAQMTPMSEMSDWTMQNAFNFAGIMDTQGTVSGRQSADTLTTPSNVGKPKPVGFMEIPF